MEKQFISFKIQDNGTLISLEVNSMADFFMPNCNFHYQTIDNIECVVVYNINNNEDVAIFSSVSFDI